MLIPFAGCFNIIIVTDVPAYVLPNTILPVFILIWDKNSAPWDEVVNSLGDCIAESTPRENMKNPFRKNISLNISGEEALILCSSNKPFSLHLKPGTSQLLMNVMYVYISFLASKWMLAMYQFWLPGSISLLSLFFSNFSQLPSIFRVLYLHIKFSFTIYIYFACKLYSFLQQSVNIFLFYPLKIVVASSHLINSSIEKDRFLQVSLSWVKPLAPLLLER